MEGADYLALADWRRQVAEMYGLVRVRDDDDTACFDWRAARDRLFAKHPMTPLTPEQLRHFNGLDYFDYDPSFSVRGRFESHNNGPVSELTLPAEGLFRYRQIGWVHFQLLETALKLALYWIEGYGGGLFLPFRDLTNKGSTYGGGRYLFDGIKGADLNWTTDRVNLDFNFAYNPSCAYDDRWVCPLAPTENKLAIAVMAGEKAFA